MSLNIATASTPVFAQPALAPARAPAFIEDMVLHHLKTRAQIERILHLREEIDLSVHAAAGDGFVTLEKKETSAVSSSVSSWMARS